MVVFAVLLFMLLLIIAAVAVVAVTTTTTTTHCYLLLAICESGAKSGQFFAAGAVSGVPSFSRQNNGFP